MPKQAEAWRHAVLQEAESVARSAVLRGNHAFIGEAKFLENELLARGVEVEQRRSVSDVVRCAGESRIEAVEEVEDEL